MIMNNFLIVISVISIVAVLMYIPLKLGGVLPIRDNLYRSPLKPSDFKKSPKSDPNLIQYKKW